MNTEITQSIEVRRDALYNHYDLPPEARAKSEELFGRMEELGRGCADRTEFETKFAASPLAGEYNDLFSALVKYVRLPEGTPTPKEYARTTAASQAKSVVRGQAERSAKSLLVRMMPDELHRWYTQGIHRIPIIGDIVSAGNTANVFQKLFRRRPKPKDAGDKPEEQ